MLQRKSLAEARQANTRRQRTMRYETLAQTAAACEQCNPACGAGGNPNDQSQIDETGAFVIGSFVIHSDFWFPHSLFPGRGGRFRPRQPTGSPCRDELPRFLPPYSWGQ